MTPCVKKAQHLSLLSSHVEGRLSLSEEGKSGPRHNASFSHYTESKYREQTQDSVS